jgi:uncharacterized protein (DUF2384 family)
VRIDSSTDLTDRIIHVAYLLDLGDAEIAGVLGASELFVTDLRAARHRSGLLDTDAGQRAGRLIAIYEALTLHLHRWSEVRLWFDTAHKVLGGRPIDLVQSKAGLDAIFRYIVPSTER